MSARNDVSSPTGHTTHISPDVLRATLDFGPFQTSQVPICPLETVDFEFSPFANVTHEEGQDLFDHLGPLPSHCHSLDGWEEAYLGHRDRLWLHVALESLVHLV